MATRYTANTDESTTLTFQLYKNGVKADAYAINRVIIYRTNADAVADINPYITIENTDISRPDVGLYEYTAPIITSSGTYYDKMYLIPTSTGVAKGYINSFTVADYTGAPATVVPICNVYGNLIDGTGSPVRNAKITFTVDTIPAIENSTYSGIVPESVFCLTTSTGAFAINLVRLFIYRVNIKAMGYSERIQVPDAASTTLWALTTIPVVADPTPGDPGAEPNW